MRNRARGDESFSWSLFLAGILGALGTVFLASAGWYFLFGRQFVSIPRPGDLPWGLWIFLGAVALLVSVVLFLRAGGYSRLDLLQKCLVLSLLVHLLLTIVLSVVYVSPGSLEATSEESAAVASVNLNLSRENDLSQAVRRQSAAVADRDRSLREMLAAKAAPGKQPRPAEVRLPQEKPQPTPWETPAPALVVPREQGEKPPEFQAQPKAEAPALRAPRQAKPLKQGERDLSAQRLEKAQQEAVALENPTGPPPKPRMDASPAEARQERLDQAAQREKNAPKPLEAPRPAKPSPTEQALRPTPEAAPTPSVAQVENRPAASAAKLPDARKAPGKPEAPPAREAALVAGKAQVQADSITEAAEAPHETPAALSADRTPAPRPGAPEAAAPPEQPQVGAGAAPAAIDQAEAQPQAAGKTAPEARLANRPAAHAGAREVSVVAGAGTAGKGSLARAAESDSPAARSVEGPSVPAGGPAAEGPLSVQPEKAGAAAIRGTEARPAARPGILAGSLADVSPSATPTEGIAARANPSKASARSITAAAQAARYAPGASSTAHLPTPAPRQEDGRLDAGPAGPAGAPVGGVAAEDEPRVASGRPAESVEHLGGASAPATGSAEAVDVRAGPSAPPSGAPGAEGSIAPHAQAGRSSTGVAAERVVPGAAPTTDWRISAKEAPGAAAPVRQDEASAVATAGRPGGGDRLAAAEEIAPSRGGAEPHREVAIAAAPARQAGGSLASVATPGLGAPGAGAGRTAGETTEAVSLDEPLEQGEGVDEIGAGSPGQASLEALRAYGPGEGREASPNAVGAPSAERLAARRQESSSWRPDAADRTAAAPQLAVPGAASQDRGGSLVAKAAAGREVSAETGAALPPPGVDAGSPAETASVGMPQALAAPAAVERAPQGPKSLEPPGGRMASAGPSSPAPAEALEAGGSPAGAAAPPAAGSLLARAAPQQKAVPAALPATESQAPARLALSFDAQKLASHDWLFQRSAKYRQELVQKLGGSPQTEEAVERALDFLARAQEPEGRWTRFNTEPAPGRRGKTIRDVALTGLSSLCFLAADHVPNRRGPYQQVIAKALDYLISQQKDDGDLRGSGDMYGQALGTLALAEAALMTGEARYREAAIRGARFIVQSQNRSTGGWRYHPGDAGDTSVLGWQVMALFSVEHLDVKIPDETRRGALRWLDRVSGRSPQKVLAGYVDNYYSPAMSAEAAFSRILLGQTLTPAQQDEISRYIYEHRPGTGWRDVYLWYYSALTLMQFQNETWRQWNPCMQEQLLKTQRHDGVYSGSWEPAALYSLHGGRIYNTAMSTLMLEVYYRYLPMYVGYEKAEEIEKSKGKE